VSSAGNVPANPIEKAGYRLEFHDEFDGPDLDTSKWLPVYLPQWSSRARSAPEYGFGDGALILHITEAQQPWCPEFDGEIRCSSLQTGVYAGPLGSAIGQHRFRPACVVREEQEPMRTYTPRYGYFEVRAKAVRNAINHVSLWMIGYEDEPERSAEIAVMEILGDGIGAQQSQIGYGVRAWSDPAITDEFYVDPLPIDATGYHIYAAEWTPAQIDFYVDNRKVRTIHQSPKYPMQFMLSLYERPQRRSGAVLRDPSHLYPKAFVVDYFRAYQPIGGYAGQADAA
jgi:hypothetical protein